VARRRRWLERAGRHLELPRPDAPRLGTIFLTRSSVGADGGILRRVMRPGSWCLIVIVVVSLVGCTDGDDAARETSPTSPTQRTPGRLVLPPLPEDLPTPPERLVDNTAGGPQQGKLTHAFLPPRNVKPEVGGERLRRFYEKAMPAAGWTKVDEQIEGEGEWASIWSKQDRVVRLGFAAPPVHGPWRLLVEQCPPLSPAFCRS
jgi:hypothetical protein